jgi:hypothetical protein
MFMRLNKDSRISATLRIPRTGVIKIRASITKIGFPSILLLSRKTLNLQSLEKMITRINFKFPFAEDYRR